MKTSAQFQEMYKELLEISKAHPVTILTAKAPLPISVPNPVPDIMVFDYFDLLPK